MAVYGTRVADGVELVVERGAVVVALAADPELLEVEAVVVVTELEGMPLLEQAPQHDGQAHEQRDDQTGADAQRFFQLGARFSANAFGPSFASSLLKTSFESSDSIL
ncbi:MAG TPA: hypothetical protein VIX84_03250 [Acidimicrobiales bacterium]